MNSTMIIIGSLTDSEASKVKFCSDRWIDCLPVGQFVSQTVCLSLSVCLSPNRQIYWWTYLWQAILDLSYTVLIQSKAILSNKRNWKLQMPRRKLSLLQLQRRVSQFSFLSELIFHDCIPLTNTNHLCN